MNSILRTLLVFILLAAAGFAADTPMVAEWRKRAEAGDAAAQYYLGLMYDSGNGVPKDYDEAAKWWRKAADQGDADAQGNLGIVYDGGSRVWPPKDSAEAVKWYRKAADQGYGPAQTNLGVMYTNGEGVPEDATEAAKWYRKAADQGFAIASTGIKKDEEDDGEDEEDDGGMKFFLKAQMKFAQALLPATRIAEMNDEIKVMRSKTDPREAVILTKKYIAENQAAAEFFIKNGDVLNAEARSLISEGKDEAAKGVAKWALISVAAYFIDKDKNLDKNTKAAFGMIIAEEAMSDLSDLNEMLSTIEKLNSIGSSK